MCARAQVLDPALTRPGRLSRRVVVPLPDERGRADILAVHLRQVRPLRSILPLCEGPRNSQRHVWSCALGCLPSSLLMLTRSMRMIRKKHRAVRSVAEILKAGLSSG